MSEQNEAKHLWELALARRDFMKWAGALGLASGGALGYLFSNPELANAATRIATANSSFTPLRPPATPLIVRGPYVNTWLPADNAAGTWPTFWQGTIKAITGIARIDNTPYIFLGAPGGIGTVGTMNQTNLQVTATQSIYTFQAGGITLTLTFLSPVEATDLRRQSIPLSSIFAQAQSNDGNTHTVSLYFDISAEWSHSDTSQLVNWSRNQVAHNGGSLTSMTFSLVSPTILSENSDYATWGNPVWATATVNGLTTQIGQDIVVRANAAHNGALDNSIDGNAPRAINNNWPVLGFNFALGGVGSQATTPIQLVLGHVRTPAVSYLGQQLQSLWQTYWSSSDQMLAFFYDDAQGALQRANNLDNQIYNDANNIGGSNYAAICVLATRQALGAMELVNSPSNTPWLVLKEVSTGGAFSTVDVVYPAFPILLYLNPDLLVPFLDPILTYCESGHWPQTFCVHDLGGYPNAGGHNDGGGENMPVEESANMLIMAAAYTRFGNQGQVGGFAQQHYRILHQWADYLNAPNGGNPSRPNALDPLYQNQTDDFTGLIAHSTNLALKGIIGIGAMSLIAQAAGNTADASFYQGVAVNLISQWTHLGQDASQPHLDIAYSESDTAANTGQGTYSLKYNSYPDKVLGLNLIPRGVEQEEVAWYKTKENAFGVPLDSRNTWIKTDWAVWASAGIGDLNFQQYFFNAIYHYVNTTPDRHPFTDLFDTISGRQSSGGFIARPVIGGLFTLLNLNQSGSTQNYAYYKILNYNSGKVMAVNGQSTSDGAQVTQWDDNGTPDHLWYMVNAGNGQFKLFNQNSGLLLAVSGASQADSANVTQWDDNGTPDHLWSRVDAGNGYFHIINYNSGKLLAVQNASTADGAFVQQYHDNGTADHLWRFVGVPITGINYKIQNQNSGKLLAVNVASTADGAFVQQYHDNGTPDHLWQFIDNGNGYYRIMNYHSGKVVAVNGQSTTAGAQVTQWDDNGTPDHLWQLADAGNGYYKIFNFNSGLLLAVNGASTADSANVTQWNDNGTTDHLWKLIPF